MLTISEIIEVLEKEAVEIALKSLKAWDEFLNAQIPPLPAVIGRYEDGFVAGIESAGLLAQQLLRRLTND